ncbi:MAG: hypothetical protein ACYT04_31795 [Nostoc sp.]
MHTSTLPRNRGWSLRSAIAAPATNEAIAYSTQKAMILSSDSSSLMLFFPRLIRGAIAYSTQKVMILSSDSSQIKTRLFKN